MWLNRSEAPMVQGKDKPRRNPHPSLEGLQTSHVRLPVGIEDYAPDRSKALHRALEQCGRLFELHGYERVYTPMFEIASVAERGLGRREKRNQFKLVDPSTGEFVVLRPDFTAQIARMVAGRMAQRPRPLRLSYEGRVVRPKDPNGRGLETRDAFQTGIECIGDDSRSTDLEVLRLASRCFGALERDVVLSVSHAGIVEGLLPEGTSRFEAWWALSSKDRAAVRSVSPQLEPLADLYGPLDELPQAKAALRNAPEPVRQALDELVAFSEAVVKISGSGAHSFDLGDPRGLQYFYSGLFYQGYVADAPQSVLRGGRYDRLMARYGRTEPALGFTLDVGSIVGDRPKPPNRSGVVLIRDTDRVEQNVDRFDTEADRLRDLGERVLVLPEAQARAYALSHGYSRLCRLQVDGGLEIAEVFE
jgi:ATP phosphoribosyltransferase regulatory subunit